MKHVDTIVMVEDIQVSKAFYLDVIGLEVLHDWNAMVVFQERFAIHQADRLLPEAETARFVLKGAQGHANVIVYFETDDLQRTFDELRSKGVTFVHGIVQLPQQRIFRVADPDGHILEIGEPF
jgi:catechol 2,3-dioxygenase-like lactoylglutathione lyase family enzyme